MTTKVKIECPETSHWNLVVTTEAQLYDTGEGLLTSEWRATGQAPIILKPLESHETYIHASLRLIVSEGEPVKTA